MSATPDAWLRVKSAFEAALERPPTERQSLLAASGLDEADLVEVRSLLLHHDEVTVGDEFLAAQAGNIKKPISISLLKAAPPFGCG